MKIYLTTLLVFFIVLQGLAYGIHGTVTWKENGIPATEAKILVAGTDIIAKVEEDGTFEIMQIEPGQYQLIAFAIGANTVSEQIFIDSADVSLNLQIDSLSKNLKEVVITSYEENIFNIARLEPVEGTAIYAGKKSEVVLVDNMVANLATNNSRQIYAKVSGLNIYESDGAGIQLGIGGRGLDPNRVSNFNTRQNGYDMSADALGYPESYYSPPTEALERVEIVRGAASLQYGTQFGGFVNFKIKEGPSDKPIEVVSRQTVGSYGLFNTFNSIGGTKGKINYYSFYQYKRGNGWRENSGFDVHTAFGGMKVQATEKLQISAEYTFMHYLAQQPGGLTDFLFEQDPRQSIRDRNWFQVNWNLGAVILDYKLNNSTKINSRTFGLIGGRDALGFLGQITRVDPLVARDLLKDDFRNFGNETRLIHQYDFRDQTSVFLIGARYYNGRTLRKQGDGSAGFGPDFDYLHPDSLEHSDYVFPGQNVALFSENIFNLTSKFSITPGIRWEYIDTRSAGYYRVAPRDLADNLLYEATIKDDRTNKRSFILLGVGLNYKFNSQINAYANFSQNYRSINFNDMRIVNPNFRVDPNLQDEKGYSTDIGIRGNVQKLLNFDVSLFYLKYNDRIGAVLKTDTALFNTYRLRTNVADSRNYGLESFVELNLFQLFEATKTKNDVLTIFSNFSLMDAKYVDSEEAAYEEKQVELVPAVIFKTGLSYIHKRFKTSFQYSYTSRQFTDATNADFTANAVNGIIPAYAVVDFSLQYTYKKFTIESGINNLTNNKYFTRRAAGYPGPGIIPSDGINTYLTLVCKLN